MSAISHFPLPPPDSRAPLQEHAERIGTSAPAPPAPQKARTHIRHRPFARIIPHQAGPRPIRADAGDVDDGAAAALLERGHGGGDAVEDALDVDGEAAVELVLGDVEGRLVAVARAGVVDDDVEAAELVFGRGDERGPDGRVRHGARHGRDVVRDVGARKVRREPVAVEVGRHHLAALADEEARRREAEARCRACRGVYGVSEVRNTGRGRGGKGGSAR